ncbi:MAG: redoxin domain-containing protein [Firmicutes bacterium]|nr:redoxin domain-containing protein [Bacillota bacterium]
MRSGSRPLPRWAGFLIVALIALGLAWWELARQTSGPGSGPREAAVILTVDGPFPPVLYVENGTDYRIAFTSLDEEYALEGVPQAEQPAVGPGQVVFGQLRAEPAWNGRRLGPYGPTVRVVDSLDTLVARGEVYPVAVIAGERELIPRQVRLPEGGWAQVGGTSLSAPRMLAIAGTDVHLALWPGQRMDLTLEVPGPGTYAVECEQGCEPGGWRGAFRVEAVAGSVPWVESRDSGPAEIGRPAPDFALYDLNGRVVRLSDFRGKKPVFVNFWATWCPPCRREMPAMEELLARRGEEVAILAVNYREPRDQVDDFMKELALTFPALLDVRGDVAHRYDVWSYPTSVFIDADGIIRGRFIGELSPAMMDDFIDALTADAAVFPSSGPPG